MQQLDYSIFPEKEVIYGTFWQRFFAALIDGIIMYIPGIFINNFFEGQNLILQLYNHIPFTSGAFLAWIVGMIPGWLYYASMESSMQKATVGKMALGLIVTDMNGEKISFGRATGRYFAKSLSALIIFIGYLMMLWDSRNQTLHDKLAGTLVVKKTIIYPGLK